MVDISVIQQKLDDDLLPFRSYGTFSDSNVAGVRADALSASLLKKFSDVTAEDADQRAIQLFLECNTKCMSFVVQPKQLYVNDVLERARLALFDQFQQVNLPIVTADGRYGGGYSSTFSARAIYERAKMGPGASVGCKSNDYYTKLYNSPLCSTSEELTEMYLRAIEYHPSLRDAEVQRSQTWGSSIVSGSSLSTVPKKYDISRTICTEPPLNMFFQLGAGSLIDDLNRRYHNLSQKRVHDHVTVQQEVNRAMARRGSIDGLFSTIDLSSASDSISMSLCKYLLPSDVFEWLKVLRSPTCRLPNGELVNMAMISSMGNGFTFPLQSLLFATVVRSAYEVLGINPITRGPQRNYAVNGDDIICLTETYHFVCSCLTACGFVVNDDKSFSTGHFRESCGGDFFRGFDVRGVYIKSLSTTQAIYSSVNRLNRWTEQSGIPLPSLISHLLGMIPKRQRLEVPPDSADTAGLHVPVAPSHLRRNGNGSVVYYYYKPQPASIKVDGRWPYAHVLNYYGLLQAALGGYVRNHRIFVRPRVVRYKVACGVSPNWGHQRAQNGLRPGLDHLV